MKKEIVTLFLMTSVWAAQAQGTFTIEGQVKECRRRSFNHFVSFRWKCG